MNTELLMNLAERAKESNVRITLSPIGLKLTARRERLSVTYTVSYRAIDDVVDEASLFDDVFATIFSALGEEV